MMNITYGMTEEIYSVGADTRVAYGIAAYANADEDGTATVISSVHDVASDKQAVLHLVLLCNRLELSPIHLNEIVENFLVY